MVDKHIYVDEAKSGAIQNRPGLEALKQSSESREFVAVIVDDASRLSRDNHHFNTLLCLFQFWDVNLISVSDGLDMREEHAKVAYQFRGIINELYLSDLRKKTHRGQMGQVLRGYCMGGKMYGYESVPDGEPKLDAKGRLRADGFKRVIVPEEARTIQRIFRDFAQGISITQLAKNLNDEKIPTKTHPQGGWRTSTIARILKDEKHIGRYTWNKTKTLKDPMSGQRKQVPRPKQEWIIQDRPEMRIVTDDLWRAVQKRWAAIEKTYPTQRGLSGLKGQQKSYVSTHPPHLLSGALRCGECNGSISLVSGKGSGYYGCLNAVRHACCNKMLISRKKIEKQFVDALYKKVCTPDNLALVFQKTAEKIAEQFAYIPDELRLKQKELQKTEARIHNFIEFIAQGRAPSSLINALEQEENKADQLRMDIKSLETASENVFEPPTVAWIKDRLDNLQQLLEQRTEQSALAIRRLTGPITLTPRTPKQGRKHFYAICKFKSFALLEPDAPAPAIPGGLSPPEDNGSISYTWWR